MKINKVCVVGAGTMGHGIAQMFAMRKYNVILIDHKEENLKRALNHIGMSLERFISKKKIYKKEKPQMLKRIKTSTDINSASSCQLIIEAVTEKMYVKKRIFKSLDNICSKKSIFTSNTSSLSITKLASFVSHPERFIGMHFFNPPQIMELVELIKGIDTSQQTFKTVERVCSHLNKTSVEIKDFPGFVANRMLIPMLNEAMFTLMNGVASKEEIDTVMKLGMRHPMGPLELADFIGLDVVLHIMENLYEEYEDSKYRVCPLLKKMVEAGHLGKKTGKGFYNYKKERK